MVHGAVADRTLPVPGVATEEDGWAEEREDIQDVVVFADGAWNENAAVFELKDSLDTVLALDIDDAETDDEVVKEAEAAAVERMSVDFREVDEFWDLVIVRNFFAKCGTSSCLVPTAAVGQQVVDSEKGVFYVQKKWKIVTTRLKLIEVMAPYARVPEHLGPADFRPCCGKVRVLYTPFFAELVWRAFRTFVAMPARTRADLVPESCFPASKPSMPLWCAMVTRTISLKCEEAQEPETKEAVAKDVGYHVERGTWDISRVRELSEWMRDDAYSCLSDACS